MTGTDFLLLSPQIALAALALLLVAFDLGLPAARRRYVAYAGAAGMLVPSLLQIAVARNRQSAFFDTLVVDDLATFVSVLLMVAAALVMLLSADFISHRSGFPGEFAALVSFATLGFTIMASGRELLTLYIGLETASISLYILAGFLKNDKESSESGIKYVLLGAMASAILLYGVALLYGATGSTQLAVIAERVRLTPVVALAMLMITAGLGFKVAAVPFHMWAPDVYQGSPPPSVALIASSSKLAGFALLLRIFVTALPGLAATSGSVFAVIAVVTMTIGNLGALQQTNVKRLLGYSSVAQAGYALMALAAVTSASASGLLFFLVAYVLTTLAAFAVVTQVSAALGSDDLSAYDGLSARSPVLALAMLLAMLSLVGLPLLGGFWGKVYLFLGVFSAGQVWLVIIALANSVVAAFYYVRVIFAMYLRPADGDAPVPIGGALGLSLGVSTVGILVMGFVPAPFLAAATSAATALVR